MPFSPENLLPGDLIFFMDALGMPTHAAIYYGKREGTHFITHATTGSYDAVMTTRLKPDDFPYEVFRCDDFNLASQAAIRLGMWAKSGTPFSYEKHDQIFEHIEDDAKLGNPKTGSVEQCNLAQSYFTQTAYRYINYAAHPEFPFFTASENLEGFYCSEAIVAAFNTQELINAEAIKTTRELNLPWVTDKTTLPLSEIKSNYNASDAYLDYLNKANSQQEYPFGALTFNAIKDGHYAPAIAAWDFEKYSNIEVFFNDHTFALALDSKLATPRALYTHCQQNTKRWQNLGSMVIEQALPFPQEHLENQKQKWKEYVENLFAMASEKKRELAKKASSAQTEGTQKRLKPSPTEHRRSISDAHAFNAKSLLNPTEQKTATVLYKRGLPIVSPEKPNTPSNTQPASSVRPRAVRKLFG